MKKITTLLLLSVLISCGRQQVKHTEREIKMELTVTPSPELTITREKYQYTGDKYPDPFTDTISHAPIKDVTLKHAISPDLQSLRVNGVMRDKKSTYILLGSPIGNYIIEREKMYDINLRPVVDIKVNLEESTLVLQKGNEIREIDLSSWGGSK